MPKKLDFDRKYFIDCLNKVSPAVKTRSPKVEFQHYRLVSNGEQLVLFATDGDFYMITPVLKSHEGGVDVLLPGKTLSILNAMHGDAFTLAINDESIVLSQSGRRLKLQTIDPSNHAEIPNKEFDNAIVWDAGQFSEAVRRTAFCTDDANYRSAMAGVHVNCKSDCTEIIGLSERCGSLYHVSASHDKDEFNATLPVLPMMSALKCSGKESEIVHFQCSENTCEINVDGTIVGTPQVNGKYPDYEYALLRDSQCDIHVDIPTTMLSSNLKLATMVTNEETRAVKFNISEGQLNLSSRGAEVGESELSTPVSYSGKDEEFEINGEHIQKWLSTTTGEVIGLHFSNKPNKVLFVDGSNNFSIAVMRVQ